MIIPVVVGVIILGKAFDLNHVAPTENQIFDYTDIQQNIQVIPQTCSRKDYRIVKTASDVNKVLKLDPFISLKVKNKDASLVGLDSYLSTVITRNKTLEIIIVVDLETETQSFPPRVRIGSGWQDKPQTEVGTHYVSSIKYGGLLVVSLRLNPIEPKYFQQIEKAVASKISNSGSVDELFFKNLENVVKSLHKKAALSINVVSTAGLFAPPTDINDLEKLVREYPKIVSEVNGGKGQPLRIELQDLHRVQSNYTRFDIKPELEQSLEDANEKLEDLRIASKIYRDWISTNPTMNKQEKELVAGYGKRLHDSIEAFSTAIKNLHYNGESNQLEEAFNVYYKLKDNSPYRYTYTIERCIRTIVTVGVGNIGALYFGVGQIHFWAFLFSLHQMDEEYIGIVEHATTKPDTYDSNVKDCLLSNKCNQN